MRQRASLFVLLSRTSLNTTTTHMQVLQYSNKLDNASVRLMEEGMPVFTCTMTKSLRPKGTLPLTRIQSVNIRERTTQWNEVETPLTGQQLGVKRGMRTASSSAGERTT